ncbi:hypothetical protein NQ318_007122 [Aromia moschata]|uniref:Uncharacterized protein n=1 Tax=Aromia moschata TaxID=1265417 RepID=A0AAV8XEC7_9CUCU|nr:hypothetical protein NQ318_007122 [Aromia moschata]
MPLNERDRIEILMMIGVGDRMRTQQEVCRLFHEMHPDREPVSQSTVSRIERKYRELGHVRDAPRQGIHVLCHDVPAEEHSSDRTEYDYIFYNPHDNHFIPVHQDGHVIRSTTSKDGGLGKVFMALCTEKIRNTRCIPQLVKMLLTGRKVVRCDWVRPAFSSLCIYHPRALGSDYKLPSGKRQSLSLLGIQAAYGILTT